MKKLLLLFLLFLSANYIFSEDKEHTEYSESVGSTLGLLKITVPESLLSTIEHKPMIWYMSGHHAHNWSIILKDQDNYNILCGRIDELGENKLYTEMFDTTAFLYANREIISWGFDSLTVQAKQMIPIYKDIYLFTHRSLRIIKNDSVEFFFKTEKTTYSGPDSANFNKKLHKLSYIMLWIAFPFFRQYTPDSVYIKK